MTKSEAHGRAANNRKSQIENRKLDGGEGAITLPLVHPRVWPIFVFPLAPYSAVREGFEPSVAFWATAL
jgi:hypothetical protein